MENVLEIFVIVEYNTPAQLKIQLGVQTSNVWISFLNVNKFYNALLHLPFYVILEFVLKKY